MRSPSTPATQSTSGVNTRAHNKRKSSRNEEINGEKRVKTTDTDAAIRTIMERLGKLDEIDKNNNEMRAGIDGIRQDIRQVNSRVDSIEHRLDDVEAKIDERVKEGLRKAESKIKEKLAENVSRNAMGDKEYYYARSRRTLLFAPLNSNQKDRIGSFVNEFLRERLGMETEEVESILIEEAFPVMKRRKNTKGEWINVRMAKVTFETRTDRDMVMMRAPKLREHPESRMEMDILEHLIPLMKKMERHAYVVRRDKKLRTSIRYNDQNMSLMLLTRANGEQWTKVEEGDF